jgi:hypothetical protein
MKKSTLSIRTKMFLLTSLFFFFAGATVYAQTPGMILKKATGVGAAVLDPDGDGYVSAKTNGVQIGFTNPPNNDVTQSEIPYAAIVMPDPTSDLLSGPSCSYGDIVGVDASGNNAVLTYYDGTNLLVRFRVSNYAKNSKGYTLLIDTDQKFGFTGPNADPNAKPGNPGFEVEITLMTNFSVGVYKIDGAPSAGTALSTYPYDTYCQKAVALTRACDDPDYFYDF